MKPLTLCALPTPPTHYAVLSCSKDVNYREGPYQIFFSIRHSHLYFLGHSGT